MVESKSENGEWSGRELTDGLVRYHLCMVYMMDRTATNQMTNYTAEVTV